jgi:tRNA (guanosine-2'-O-)-methyltransferase
MISFLIFNKVVSFQSIRFTMKRLPRIKLKASFSSKPPFNSAKDEVVNDDVDESDKLWQNWSYGTFKTDTGKNYENQLKKRALLEDSADPASSFASSSTAPNLWNSNGNVYDDMRYNKFDPLWQRIPIETIQKSSKILKPFMTDARHTTLSNILSKRTNHVRFLFENPGNPNNVWATLRTLDSFGIQFIDIILNKNLSATSIRRREMNNALGSQKWMTINLHENVSTCIHQLKSEGYTIIATDLHEKSSSFKDFDFSSLAKNETNSSVECSASTEASSKEMESPKFVIVMGNEFVGISQEMRESVDLLMHIPMKGFAESFNLSVATAIICAMLESKNLLSPSLSEEIKERILFVWMLRSIRNSLTILRKHGYEFKGEEV